MLLKMLLFVFEMLKISFIGKNNNKNCLNNLNIYTTKLSFSFVIFIFIYDFHFFYYYNYYFNHYN